MLRFLFLLPVAAVLAGCVTTGASTDAPQAGLRDESKSVVLMHTALHEYCNGFIQATLARRDDAGQWVRGDAYTTLRGVFDSPGLPSQLVLPAGEYGIVRLNCRGGSVWNNRGYYVKQLTRGSIVDGSGATFDKPMATFKVLPGEVVDIGSLRLPSTPPRIVPGGITAEFVGVVAPMPEAYLQNLAAKNPDIYQRRVTRPMAAAAKI
jgi:hypothetical protein